MTVKGAKNGVDMTFALVNQSIIDRVLAWHLHVAGTNLMFREPVFDLDIDPLQKPSIPLYLDDRKVNGYVERFDAVSTRVEFAILRVGDLAPVDVAELDNALVTYFLYVARDFETGLWRIHDQIVVNLPSGPEYPWGDFQTWPPLHQFKAFL